MVVRKLMLSEQKYRLSGTSCKYARSCKVTCAYDYLTLTPGGKSKRCHCLHQGQGLKGKEEE